jgi:hypothetical protein
MKPDEFEQQLERRPPRRVPGEWRAEILRNAASSVAADVRRRAAESREPAMRLRLLTSASTGRAWWRERLWPCPHAWAGLAAICLFALIISFTSSAPERSSEMAARVPPPSPEVREALAEQRRLFAELVGNSPKSVEGDRPFVPRPRSERRVAIIYV